MNTYEFILKFTLPGASENGASYVDALGQSGCDDALIGIGNKGRVALDFSREADNALDALISAIRDVKNAIPHCQLIESCPDLVGLTDIAQIVGFTRQNLRKLSLNHRETFPSPIHDGKTSLWHLIDVLNWFEEERELTVSLKLKEIAHANRQLNISRESTKLDLSFLSKVSQYL